MSHILYLKEYLTVINSGIPQKKTYNNFYTLKLIIEVIMGGQVIPKQLSTSSYNNDRR